MFRQVTPEKVIHVVWLSAALSFCWPLPISSSRTRILGFKILQISAIISACMLLLPMLYSIYLHPDDLVVVFKCMCMSTALCQLIVQTTMCWIKKDSLQRTVREMMTCVKETQQYEKEIFYKYITRCDMLCICTIVCMYATATGFSLGPAILPISFPADAEYPFRVNYTPMNIIIYAHQSILSYQCAAHSCVSIFGALLLWFTAARFECLAVELEKSTSINTLIVCIKKQLSLRRYAEEVLNNFRIMVLFSIIISTLVLTFGGIILIVNSPLLLKLQFVIVSLTVLTEVFMYAWPADHLREMSTNVSRSAYNLIWYKQTLEMQKNLLNVLVFQEPVTLSVSCVLPELSLRYYCSYLSNAMSIFTALRAAIGDNST
ncbi:uncharacterized protein [Bombus fervidus]|uniref:uncharacterized protein n=1 Tax=Bombus fervidus TaxID=203811 RepID=UPI003AB76ECB